MDQSLHPNDEEVAAFLDGALPAGERDTISRHLSTCDECRALLVSPPVHEAGEVNAPTKARRPTNRVRGGLVAALAAVVVIAVALRVARSGAPAPDIVSGPVTDSVVHRVTSVSATPPARETLIALATSTGRLGPQLTAFSPAGGASVLVDSLVFRWSRLESRTVYTVSIVDSTDRVIWSARINTTHVAPPPDVKAKLRLGVFYYWRVSAQQSDLRTIETPKQSFVLMRR